MLTPSDLSILIHYYVSPEKHPSWDAPAVKETIQSFLDDSVLVLPHPDGVPVVSEKGEAWLQEILSVPQPRQAWVNSAGKVISLPTRGL